MKNLASLSILKVIIKIFFEKKMAEQILWKAFAVAKLQDLKGVNYWEHCQYWNIHQTYQDVISLIRKEEQEKAIDPFQFPRSLPEIQQNDLWKERNPAHPILECFCDTFRAYLFWAVHKYLRDSKTQPSSDGSALLQELRPIAEWMVRIVEDEHQFVEAPLDADLTDDKYYDADVKIPVELAKLVLKADGIVAPPDASSYYCNAIDAAQRAVE